MGAFEGTSKGQMYFRRQGREGRSRGYGIEEERAWAQGVHRGSYGRKQAEELSSQPLQQGYGHQGFPRDCGMGVNTHC